MIADKIIPRDITYYTILVNFIKGIINFLIDKLTCINFTVYAFELDQYRRI